MSIKPINAYTTQRVIWLMRRGTGSHQTGCMSDRDV